MPTDPEILQRAMMLLVNRRSGRDSYPGFPRWISREPHPAQFGAIVTAAPPPPCLARGEFVAFFRALQGQECFKARVETPNPDSARNFP